MNVLEVLQSVHAEREGDLEEYPGQNGGQMGHGGGEQGVSRATPSGGGAGTPYRGALV